MYIYPSFTIKAIIRLYVPLTLQKAPTRFKLLQS